MSFFKKTFTNVKKTFESTFKNADSKRRRRPHSKLAGRRTPLVALNEPAESSPIDKLHRVKYPNNGYQSTSKIVNRAQRSQTFHHSTSKQQQP